MTYQEFKDLITLILTCAGIVIFVVCIIALFVGAYMVIKSEGLDMSDEFIMTDESTHERVLTVGDGGFIVCPGCSNAWNIINDKNCLNCGASYSYIKHNNKINLKYYSNLDEICNGK